MSNSAASAAALAKTAPSAVAPAKPINFCPNCKTDWVKAPGYTSCWSCGEEPGVATSASAPRTPDDSGDQPIDMAAAVNAVAKAKQDGSFWLNFQDVAKKELAAKTTRQKSTVTAPPRGREAKNGAFGPGSRSTNLPMIPSMAPSMAGPSTPIPMSPLVYSIAVYFHLSGIDPWPLIDGCGLVEFSRSKVIRDLDGWIRHQIIKHPEYQGPGLFHTQSVVIEDPDKTHKAFISLKKGKKIAKASFHPNHYHTVQDLFAYIDALRVGEFRDASILFSLPVIETEWYPLDDPRNDVRHPLADLPSDYGDDNDSADEARSRSSRGRSLGVSHQLGRKRSKTPMSKNKKIKPRNSVEVLELPP